MVATRRFKVAAALVAALLAACIPLFYNARTAEAVLPGVNGKIAFQRRQLGDLRDLLRHQWL